MFNLIRSYLYTTLRSTSTWIILVIMLLINALTITIAHVSITDTKKEMSANTTTASSETETSETSSQDAITVEIEYDENFGEELGYYNLKTKQANFAALYLGLVKDSFFVLFILLAIVLFYNLDRKNGFIKNIAGQISKPASHNNLRQGSSAFSLGIAKLVVAFLQILNYYAILLAFNFLVAKVLYQDQLILGTTTTYFWASLGLVILLCFALACLIYVPHLLSRSQALSILIAILLPLNLVSNVLMNIINFLISKLNIEVNDFQTQHLFLSQSLSILPVDGKVSDLLPYLITALVYIVICLILSWQIIKRKDIE